MKIFLETASKNDVTPILRALIAGCGTLLYTQLITFEGDDFHSATAETVNGVKQLVEAGFEYVCEVEDIKLFRKRKRVIAIKSGDIVKDMSHQDGFRHLLQRVAQTLLLFPSYMLRDRCEDPFRKRFSAKNVPLACFIYG